MKMKIVFVYLLATLMAFYSVLGYATTKGEVEVTSSLAGKDEGSIGQSAKVRLQETYGKLPLYFIQNNGQVDKRVRFYEKGSGHATYFTKEGVYLSLIKDQRTEDRGQSQDTKSEVPSLQFETIKLIPQNANKDPEIVAEGMKEGKVNYLIGNDSKKWKTNIPTYKAVVYKELYKGIDMKFYGNNRQMEYDIIVKPGADPNTVRLSYEGIEGLKATKEGDLEISLLKGKIIQKRPYIYQEIAGKKNDVEGRFIVEGNFSYGFQVASYNKSYPLIIDPVLAYSTYLGGSSPDFGYDIAVDTSGNAYIIGYTSSDNFPMASPIQGSNAGSPDAFVTKINSSGTSLVYSTYLGGSSSEFGWGIAVDASGNAYVTGQTSSTDFPTTSPIQGSSGGNIDAFVAKIDASGTSLVYSTYLGGSTYDAAYDIAVDTSGNAYVAGETESDNFPTASPMQGNKAGSYDAFITKINSSGTNLVYSTYLGGSTYDAAYDIAVDTSGNAYITGETRSTDFPTASPIQGNNGGNADAFVTKINSLGTSLVYSTYLGGSSSEYGRGIAVDASDSAYVTGHTQSTDFPMASPIQGSNAGSPDAFVTKINSSGGALVYSTYLGGSSWDTAYDIAVDTSGNAYLTGYTISTDFPTASPIQGNNGGNADAFVTKINSLGTSLVYSTYLGGSLGEYGNSSGIAVDTFGNAYVTGMTQSTDFPTSSPIQGNNGGNADVFVAKISSAVSGCVNIGGSPLINATVTLRQPGGGKDESIVTNDSGCYNFDNAVSGKWFKVIIDGPVVP